MATASPLGVNLDLREQAVRIDKMQGELAKTQVEIQKLIADTAKVRQETRCQVWTVITTALGAGAALFAAGGASVKLLGG